MGKAVCLTPGVIFALITALCIFIKNKWTTKFSWHGIWENGINFSFWMRDMFLWINSFQPLKGKAVHWNPCALVCYWSGYNCRNTEIEAQIATLRAELLHKEQENEIVQLQLAKEREDREKAERQVLHLLFPTATQNQADTVPATLVNTKDINRGISGSLYLFKEVLAADVSRLLFGSQNLTQQCASKPQIIINFALREGCVTKKTMMNVLELEAIAEVPLSRLAKCLNAPQCPAQQTSPSALCVV